MKRRASRTVPRQQPLRHRRHHAAVTTRWFRQSPILGIAFRLAKKKFSGIPGVLGFGLGRKYHESTRQYGIAPENTGGLCIKILVEKKHRKVPRRDRIPKSLLVPVPGKKRKQRVLLDIVTLGRPHSESHSISRLEAGRGWPTAGVVTVGRLFAFGKQTSDNYRERFPNSDAVRLGTTGAVIKTRTGPHYAFSAGHVFVQPCKGESDRPTGIRALGVSDQTFHTIDGSSFVPLSLTRGTLIRDAMGFEIPRGLLPDRASWPDGFTQELATPQDIDRALVADGQATGFVWVERQGRARPVMIPVDLEIGSPEFTIKIDCDGQEVQMTYGMSWGLRFLDDTTTMEGDSGAPVFLYTEDNVHCRLLGFHYLNYGEGSYATHARTFFGELFNDPDRDIEFAM